MSWKPIAQASQASLLKSIPERWRLDLRKYKSLRDVTNVPYTCGILTDAQLKITELTAVEILRGLEARELKAVQVLEAFAARAAIAHQLVNCLTDWFFEEGLQQAEELDDLLDSGGKLKGPLHGIPIAVKDFHFLKGHPTTTGYVSKRNFVPEHDSALVATLRAAGAVFFCKTTMPQTGMALETASNLWGRTLSPFNIDLSSGGSSGGDAALVAMRGCPITPSTDMGGSIRVPAAFNGLYAIRPTADRVPKGGMDNINSTGQTTIQLSCGPICHSIGDLELLTKVINAYPHNKYDVTCAPIPWRNLDTLKGKLTFGMMRWDGVVMPHPPILRAMGYVKQFDIYYQSGAGQTLAAVEASGEPLLPAVADLLKVYNTRELSTIEALGLNVKTRIFKERFRDAWSETNRRTTTSRPIDALICPPAPSAGIPHNFNIYWGYTSLFNLLDYPSVILPVPKFKIDAQKDPMDVHYRPLETNPYDKTNHDLYDPNLFSNQPSTIQIVGRPFEDEELIRVASILDTLLHST
ncbi:unnamed protein product [Clonostachys byssicola]|uniref:Amidase domain-containing protein n=1 Tax=Clonostachys byssicola TaxID=160290 RepID=A0A9N9YBL3_9HYPO|nr:unnamed protein product [Clonostachys byssicola]